MTGGQDLETRVVELETRMAFQDQAVQELSDALAAARDGESRNALLLHRALDDLRQLRDALATGSFSGDGASEPPPPHY